MNYNSKLKLYPDGNYVLNFSNRRIFSDEPKKMKKKKKKKVEVAVASSLDVVSGLHNSSNDLTNVLRSVKRAKDRIFDIIYLNHFDYFITITFNPKLVDSYNVNDVMFKLRSWLNNQRIRYNMSYILIPEYHRSGRIHAHLLVSGGNLNLSFSGVLDTNGNKIYNVGSWSYGFSTAIPIYSDNNARLSNYVTKYLTKDTKKIFGKYYWSSRNLVRDVPTEYFDSNFNDIELNSYNIPHTNIYLKYYSHFAL